MRRLIPRAVSNWFSAVATTLGMGQVAAYFASDPRRKPLQGQRPIQSTANQALTANLSVLRAHCRNLERNNPTARAGVEGLTACVVGSGIGLEPDTGNQATDDALRAEWRRFCENCTVNGHDLYWWQAQQFREMVIAGEGVSRLVILPERARQGDIPLAILPLEAEWIAEGQAQPTYDAATETMRVGGIDLDKLGRARTYYLINPEVGNDHGGTTEPVPAREMIHVYELRRSLQARGEPWMSPVIETLYQERDLVVAELQAAKTGAGYSVAITADVHDPTTVDASGDPVTDIPIGSTVRLLPGEHVETIASTRPSQAIAPFRQMLRGDIAGALRLPQRFLDRDVSRANYSSMRADMLDTERLLAPVREWFGHATAGRIYKEVLPWLCLRAGIRLPSRAAYRLLPDGQPYVDPQKDIAAANDAIKSDLSTYEAEIGKRGGDYRQVVAQRERERELSDASFVKRIAAIDKAIAAAGVAATWQQVVSASGADVAPATYLAAATPAPEPDPQQQKAAADE